MLWIKGSVFYIRSGSVLKRGSARKTDLRGQEIQWKRKEFTLSQQQHQTCVMAFQQRPTQHQHWMSSDVKKKNLDLQRHFWNQLVAFLIGIKRVFISLLQSLPVTFPTAEIKCWYSKDIQRHSMHEHTQLSLFFHLSKFWYYRTYFVIQFLFNFRSPISTGTWHIHCKKILFHQRGQNQGQEGKHWHGYRCKI